MQSDETRVGTVQCFWFIHLPAARFPSGRDLQNREFPHPAPPRTDAKLNTAPKKGVG